MFFQAMLFFGIAQMSELAEARTCEGGYTCTLPRECCTQGCCPSYHSGPRQLTPPSEHVLNLFFISHWFFWCVVVAIILAILCAYSLWKKRRTLCGWGFPEHRAQSEGDSAGSCYAPPQYSRCSSFHHPPPPYTEVTSKPDLYPLVFTCNNDHGKTGSSYLMVQYFRNYIVRPAAGTLSAASTVDSLSSSFICNVNEANTLVPPTYSRAASPEIGYSASFQHHHHHYMLPRSASQLVCPPNLNQLNNGSPQAYYNQQRASHYNAVLLTGAVGGDENAVIVTPYHAQLNRAESGNFDLNEASSDSKQSVVSVEDNNEIICHQRADGFTQSQSDQHFRYAINSNSSISDIFVNGATTATAAAAAGFAIDHERTLENVQCSTEMTSATAAVVMHGGQSKSLLQHNGVATSSVVLGKGTMKTPNPLQRTSTNPAELVCEPQREAVYNSCNSIGGISITMPVAGNSNSIEPEFNDLRVLRRSLETCCKYLHKQQQTRENPPRVIAVGDSPLRSSELAKKYADESSRSYLTSGTCSGVSSLANIGTPSSPPQATSPTGEVKEILDQIRQLQVDTQFDALNPQPHSARHHTLHHTMSTPSPKSLSMSSAQNKRHSADLQRYATMPEQEQQQHPVYVSPTATTPPHKISAQRSTTSLTNNSSISSKASTSSLAITLKRPSSFQQQNKKKFSSPKPNRTMYIPMTSTTTNAASSSRCILRSPVGSMVASNFFANRGRMRKGWISRSAPTTPGTCLPPNCLGDDSPLLNEHEEDQEGEQNAELE